MNLAQNISENKHSFIAPVATLLLKQKKEENKRAMWNDYYDLTYIHLMYLSLPSVTTPGYPKG